MTERAGAQPDSLASLLGGRGGAIDATVPTVAFALGWWLSNESIMTGVIAAVTLSAIIAVFRLKQGRKPRSVVVGLLGVCAAGIIALYTGNAEDFFLLQLLSNAASMLAWIVSILVRWPFLGLIVGTVLVQKTAWRRDPDLLKAYCRASWVWVGQYTIRVATFLPLWIFGATGSLTVARVFLSWPLIVACLAASWWVFQRQLPKNHPGIRHPQVAEAPSANPQNS